MERNPFEQAIQTSPGIVGQILSVAVVSPNGGEQFQAGQQVTIQWQSIGATNQRVQYSLDGVSFTPIATGLAGSVQSTVWTIPANIVPAGQMQVTAVVRVIARDENTGDEVMDSSNGLFTIRSSTPAPTLSVTVISPNGGEQFQAGQQVTINWQSTGATNQRVQYSLNGGPFSPIVTGLAGNVQSTIWTIPANIVPAGQMQVTALVRVISRNDNTGQEVMDDSNNLFTIRSSTPAPTLSVTVISPNGGEQFQAGQQVTINWQSAGATNQRVQYSVNGGPFTPIVTGLAGNVQSTQWTIPANIVPAGQMQVTALVRVISRNDNTGQEVMDDSNNLFTIRSSTPAPTLSVTVISPNGGEQFQAGQQVTINWQSTGATNQRVQYSVNGGPFTPIVTGLAGNVQSTQWTIPANIVPAGQMQVTALVRVISRNDNTGQEVMDDSNNLFTIRSSTPAPTLSVTVISPNGGEQFQAGQQVTINWQSTGATNQRVQYSVNGGPFTPIVTGLAGNVQSTIWTIPANIVPAGQMQVTALVRVISRNDNTGQEVMDDSNNLFTIRSSTPAPTLSVTVISPNGGEQFQAGQQVTIMWQTSGATSQRVQYSLDGLNFTPIVTGLPGNVQSTQWTIPANIVPAGQTQMTAVVRVVARNDNTGQEVTDSSNAPFTIGVNLVGLQVFSEPSRISPTVGNCTTGTFASVVSGQTAKYCQRVFVKNNATGNLVPDVLVTISLAGPKVNGLSATINPNPVRTCKPDESSGCGEYSVTFQTTTNATPPGEYNFDVNAACDMCPAQTKLVTLTLVVEKPTINVTVTPDTPSRKEIFAGETAEFSIDVEKSSYLGPIDIDIKGQISNSDIIKPERIPRTDQTTGTFTGQTFMVQTFDQNKSLITPPGEYMLETKVTLPDEATTTSAKFMLKVTVRPDIGLFVSDQTKIVKAKPGKQAVFTLFLFRYNFEGSVDFSVGGQPPSPVPPVFAMVPNSIKDLPGMVGKRITYTAAIDVPENADDKLYDLTFTATGQQGAEMPPLFDQSSAQLDARLDQIILTPNKTSAALTAGQQAVFTIGIAPPAPVNLSFFAETVSDPYLNDNGDLRLSHFYSEGPVSKGITSVQLFVNAKDTDKPGNYVFDVGARRVGGEGEIVTNMPELTVSVGQPEIVLSVTSDTRPGSFQNNPVYIIMVQRINYRKKIQLAIRDLQQGVITGVDIKETSRTDTLSRFRLELKIAQGPPSGVFPFTVFSIANDVKANEITLFVDTQ